MCTLEKKQRNIEAISIGAIAIALFLVFLRMFYYQSLGNPNYFGSDLIMHIQFASSGRGYSFLYSFMGILIQIFNSSIPVCVLGSLLVVGTWFATAKLISQLGNLRYFYAAMIALPLLILTGIYLPFIYENFYKQQMVTQPYHNITYYGMRLFAVIAMIFLHKSFQSYLNRISPRHWIGLAVALVLSTSVKPSFLYGFALTLLIFLIIDFFKTRFKAKPFWQIVLMGLVVIPAVLIMFSQYMHLYGKPRTSGSSSGIMLVWGTRFFKYGVVNVILRLLCNLTFPCLVAFANRKTLSRFDKFVYCMFFVQLAITMMFAESGPRAADGNFYWGLYGAGYFLFVTAVSIFAKNIVARQKEDRLWTVYPIAGFILLAAHLLSSLAYFLIIMDGQFVMK